MNWKRLVKDGGWIILAGAGIGYVAGRLYRFAGDPTRPPAAVGRFRTFLTNLDAGKAFPATHADYAIRGVQGEKAQSFLTAEERSRIPEIQATLHSENRYIPVEFPLEFFSILKPVGSDTIVTKPEDFTLTFDEDEGVLVEGGVGKVIDFPQTA